VMNEAKWEAIPRGLRALPASASGLLPAGRAGRNFLRRLCCDGVARYRAVTGMAEDAGTSPLASATAARIAGIAPDAYRSELESRLSGKGWSLLQQMTRLDFDSWLVDDVLVKVDRASMLTSLEVRSPLLDYRIAELAYSLPDRLRCDGVTTKILLKQVARKYLPPDFPFERKMGFSIPEAEWFVDDWRALLHDLLQDGSQLLDRERVAAIQSTHLTTRRYGRELFKILMLAQFEQRYGGILE
jgi:asparagine synthase (glutamine-hydrolysing)